MFDEFILPDQQHSSLLQYPNSQMKNCAKPTLEYVQKKKIRLIIILCQDTQKKNEIEVFLAFDKNTSFTSTL